MAGIGFRRWPEADDACFAGTGFREFLGEAYAEKKVKNEIQPNLQKE
jgi:hypothetical protein